MRASNISQAKEIPVIAVTARSDMQRSEFVEHGFAGCLHKPFTVSELLGELGGQEIPQRTETETGDADTLSPHGYNFSALTAFSDNDAEASKSILESFATETGLNRERLKKGLDDGNLKEVSAVAHKMIPLFTLIGATELVVRLRELEAARDVPFIDHLKQCTGEVLAAVDEVLEQLKKEF